jgi:glycyl-tRNA synthetase
MENLMEQIVALSKRRGFIFPSGEIYGGFANSYSFGHYGTLLKKNILNLWWQMFVKQREDMYAIDGPIILPPQTWQASGHLEGFNDALVDCKNCQKRFRADHLIFEKTNQDLEGDIDALNQAFLDNKIKCPSCGKNTWTKVRVINLMFETKVNGVSEKVYLRPETAAAIFLEFNNIVDTMRPKLPFGIAQIGKAFRNEIVAGNFIFRVREFEQMEIEYFFNPSNDWTDIFENFLQLQESFAYSLGIKKEDLKRFEHPKEKLAHYSKKTVDLEFNYPFGFKELFGLAHRTDFDLQAHAKFSGEKITYFDAVNNKHIIPHVIEPSFGLERAFLATLVSAYTKETERVVLKLPHYLAPVKIAIFPLLKNKSELVKKAKNIFNTLNRDFDCEFDDNGNIGKRYRRQDEIGTPFCLTVDFETLEDNSVTVRGRDDMKQIRIKENDLKKFFRKSIAL